MPAVLIFRIDLIGAGFGVPGTFHELDAATPDTGRKVDPAGIDEERVGPRTEAEVLIFAIGVREIVAGVYAAVAMAHRNIQFSARNIGEFAQIKAGVELPLVGIARALVLAAARIPRGFRDIAGADIDALVRPARQ